MEVFQKELNESERLVFQAVHGLQRALQGDYRDVVNVKESSRQRLEALREAVIKVSTGHSGIYLLLEPSFYKIITLEICIYFSVVVFVCVAVNFVSFSIMSLKKFLMFIN